MRLTHDLGVSIGVGSGGGELSLRGDRQGPGIRRISTFRIDSPIPTRKRVYEDRVKHGSIRADSIGSKPVERVVEIEDVEATIRKGGAFRRERIIFRSNSIEVKN